jgi:hypothetical protein
MGFWNLKTLRLEELRPGIFSKVESGSNLMMAILGDFSQEGRG